MFKKIFLFIAILLFAINVFGAAECRFSGRQDGVYLSSPLTELHMGIIELVVLYEDTIYVCNDGDAALNITIAEACASWTLVPTGAQEIAAGDSLVVKIQVLYVTGEGLVSCVVDFDTDCDDVTMFAYIGSDPYCELSVSSINFGEIVLGQSSTSTVIITNMGAGILTGNLGMITGRHYKVIPASFSLTTWDSTIVAVTYRPKNARYHSDTLTTGITCSNIPIMGNSTVLRPLTTRDSADRIATRLRPASWDTTIYSGYDSCSLDYPTPGHVHKMFGIDLDANQYAIVCDATCGPKRVCDGAECDHLYSMHLYVNPTVWPDPSQYVYGVWGAESAGESPGKISMTMNTPLLISHGDSFIIDVTTDDPGDEDYYWYRYYVVIYTENDTISTIRNSWNVISDVFAPDTTYLFYGSSGNIAASTTDTIFTDTTAVNQYAYIKQFNIGGGVLDLDLYRDIEAYIIVDGDVVFGEWTGNQPGDPLYIIKIIEDEPYVVAPETEFHFVLRNGMGSLTTAWRQYVIEYITIE